MKSDVYTQKSGFYIILLAMEKIGEFAGLSESEVTKLRLLTEELLSLTIRLFENITYEFYAERNGQQFTLNLIVDTEVNIEQKDKMLSLSSEGKNVAIKGVLGKISGIFEDIVMNINNGNTYPEPSFTGYGSKKIYFSLKDYQAQISENQRSMEWDGLEKSIIAHLADDVVIGVKSNKVEVIAKITFE